MEGREEAGRELVRRSPFGHAAFSFSTPGSVVDLMLSRLANSKDGDEESAEAKRYWRRGSALRRDLGRR